MDLLDIELKELQDIASEVAEIYEPDLENPSVKRGVS
jgi:hypothetical protein